ncbi:hypothetical protein KV697_20010 (plasmid) [Sphingomonas sanguinis]|uniref:hypothetical protein n=1 Tax=Sphingomonas sanguinis TaxID=33051 RepID=UPI001C55B566|nr:hypothetical protein [Sphingomonas sanguinis]QXT38024.1 hypothetical protein KV697_20010 [Sphingomonas sanguinis]
MTVDPIWLDRIYETAVVTECWPTLLGDIARYHGATGAIVFTRTPSAFNWMADVAHQGMAQEYIDGEWYRDPYPLPLVREMHPGFRCGTDYYDIEEVEAFPVNRDFLRPRGIMADASTVVQGPLDDVVQISIIGYPTQDAARHAIASLDHVRPHLARALSLTSQIMAARAQTTVSSLALGGVPAAIVASDGRLKAMNAPFEKRMGDQCHTVRHRLRFADPFLDRQFIEQLATGFGDRLWRPAGPFDRRAVLLQRTAAGDPSPAIARSRTRRGGQRRCAADHRCRIQCQYA